MTCIFKEQEQYKSTSAYTFGKMLLFAICLVWVNVIGVRWERGLGLPKAKKLYLSLIVYDLEE
jgi:hypothetical protein